jgi:hypothetical protein
MKQMISNPFIVDVGGTCRPCKPYNANEYFLQDNITFQIFHFIDVTLNLNTTPYFLLGLLMSHKTTDSTKWACP